MSSYKRTAKSANCMKRVSMLHAVLGNSLSVVVLTSDSHAARSVSELVTTMVNILR